MLAVPSRTRKCKFSAFAGSKGRELVSCNAGIKIANRATASPEASLRLCRSYHPTTLCHPISLHGYDYPRRCSSTNVETAFEQQQMKAAVSRGNARLRMRHIKIQHCSSPMQRRCCRENELGGGWL